YRGGHDQRSVGGASTARGVPRPTGVPDRTGGVGGGLRVGGAGGALSTLACVDSLVTDPQHREGDAPAPDVSGRTYQVRTFGCQMNVRDSERMSGVPGAAGYVPFDDEADPGNGVVPDLVVFNTCAVRENADNRLYGTLGNLRPWKDDNPRLQIAVGGCLAQKDKDVVVNRAPWVDVVFGTRNL